MRSPPRLAPWLCAWLSASMLLAAPSSARGQAADAGALAAAQALYDGATKAMERRDFDAACPKLEEVVRLVPEGLGAKLSLAECYEGAGRAASAWSMYLVVEEVAGKARQEGRRALAQARAAALRPKLASLTIAVPPALRSLPGLEIKRDNAVVGAPQWGLPVPVDRGEHAIVVTAPGKRPWKKAVLVDADGRAATVEIEPLVDEPAAAPPPVAPLPPPAAPAPSVAPPPPPPPPAARFWGGQRIAGAAVGGAGLVALGVGAAFGARAIATKADAGCDGNVCPDKKGLGLFDDAKGAANVSTALFVAGGVALAAGVVVFVTAPRSPSPRALALVIEPGGVVAHGTW